MNTLFFRYFCLSLFFMFGYVQGFDHDDLVRIVMFDDVVSLQDCVDQQLDLDIKNEDELTLLMIASYYGSYRSVYLLLHAGVDIDRQCNYGCTALMYAIYQEHDDIVWLLLEKGANPNIQNNNGYTALMHATVLPHRHLLVKLLIEYGADACIENADGYTAYDIAQAFDNQDIIDYLFSVKNKN